MYLFILIVLFILAFLAIKWGLNPYFTWKTLSEKPVTGTFTVISREGRETLGDYIRKKQKEGYRVDYSIVVPAYNEERRLPRMLPKTIEYLEKMKYNYEIIVVSDASKDKTTDVAMGFSNFGGKNIDLKVLEYSHNQGKGGAVRTGVMASFGDVILMVDADGASDINEFEKLVKKLKEIEIDGHALVAGSRALVDEESNAERTFIRLVLSKVSNFIVQNICGVKLKDTQCGFKFFTKASAKSMFRTLHIRRWAFDVELFVIANEKGVPYVEIPINYQDQDESKLNVVTDSMQMARDYILIKLFYVTKLWRRSHTDKIWETYLPATDESPRTRGASPRKPKRE